MFAFVYGLSKFKLFLLLAVWPTFPRGQIWESKWREEKGGKVSLNISLSFFPVGNPVYSNFPFVLTFAK